MKNVRVKVREDYFDDEWEFGIFKGKRLLLVNPEKIYRRKSACIHAAKAMAKRIGIKYDPEIIKQHRC